MPKVYQEEVSQIRNHQKKMFLVARESWEIQGKQVVWDYRMPDQPKNFAIDYYHKKWVEYHKKAPPFDVDFIPNSYMFQYDMEMDIFLNYEEYRHRNIIINPNYKEFYQENGPTGLPREEHLLNAMSIRWPTTIKHTQEHSGLLVRNPWLEDYIKGIADYTDNIYFGGGGQGKTYASLAFMCMLYDHFIHTSAGSQCTYSTVNESKLKGSTWSYVNKLYPVSPQRKKFSLYAGLAKKAADYTFHRVDLQGKRVETGGKFVGILLPKGMKDSRVVDKLTGVHDPIARAYLLDEMQSTDGAPLDAYTNMFLHCKYGWFFGSGNFDNDHDLLGINVEPNTGWDTVNETTHKWNGTLKTPTQSLDRITNILHFNNELSPAMVDIYEGGQGQTKWPFLPTLAKRKKLYPDWNKSKNEIAAKRFWIGFRYEKQDVSESEYIITKELLAETKCASRANFIDRPINLGSFDFAPTYGDRNLLTKAGIGLAIEDGLPMIDFSKIIQFEKSSSHVEAYPETAEQVKFHMERESIASGNIILDWSSKGPLIAYLNKMGVACHFMLFQGGLPKKPDQVNPYDGSVEQPIELEDIKVFINNQQENQKLYAHQKVVNQQTLGAYLMRQALEKNRVRGFSAALLDGIKNHGWDKEMQRRKFVKDKRSTKAELMNLDDKDLFIKQYHFSTDIFDTIIQMFYMIYVKFGIRWDVPSLGKLTHVVKKPILSSIANLYKLQIGPM